MYNEEMIENVREYLNEHNDVAVDCLVNIGGCDWCEVYSLYDLYDCYCGGELDDVINLFVDSGMNATSYYRYYVKDDEVKDEDDMCDDIEETLDDDDIVEAIIDDIVNLNVNVPDELYKMCHSVTLEDVQREITEANNRLLNTSVDLLKNADDADWYLTVCKSVVLHDRIYNALMKITSSCSEDDYKILIDMVWANVIGSLVQFATGFCKGGVTVEKAVEVWIKKNILEG